MQGKAQELIQNAALFAGAPPSPVPGIGGPYKYDGKRHEYFESATTAYIFEQAQYASNYYAAEVQGIMPGTFETTRKAYLRSMDIVEQTTGTKLPNDFQSVYFQDTRIRGLYTGAKVKYGGNTWLAISPFNVADPLSSAVVRRCNAIWKHLDYYGNVLSEPFVFYESRAQATANDYTDFDALPRWYQKCAMQLNEETKEIAYNRRMILGSSAIEVRGIVDFMTDFSGQTTDESSNPEPSHILFFDVQYQQPLEIDDMERGIAGGKAFSWVILPTYEASMQIGGTQTISVSSLRNGEAPDTEKHPVSYLYESSDPTILKIDENGIVTALAEGNATVTVTLAQNPDIQAKAEISVTAEELEAAFLFIPELPKRLKQMSTYQGAVTVVRGGIAVDTPVTMAVFGAKEAADAVFNTQGNTLYIMAYEPSETPLSLVFRANDEGLTYTANIQLEGF